MFASLLTEKGIVLVIGKMASATSPTREKFGIQAIVKAKKKTAKKARGRKKSAKAPIAAATTAVILGIPQDPPRKAEGKKSASRYKPVEVKPEWEKYYKILIELHERLLNQMDGLAKESAEHLQSYGLHMADSGTDNFDRDFSLSLLSSDQDLVYEIEEALKRIEKGTYGVCELTGDPIPPARLKAIPWTRYTVKAQAKLEKEGALQQRRLGALGTVDSADSSPPPLEIEDEADAVNTTAPNKDQQ